MQRVVVKYVNYPSKPDAKFGNIKTSDDVTIMVPVARMAEFTKGATVDILTETKTWGSGADARPVIVLDGRTPRINPGQATQAGPNRSNPEQGSYQPYTAPQATYRQTGPLEPAPPPPPLAGSAGPARGNPEARSIYITGVVGRAMGSGKFTTSEIAVLTEEAGRVYDLLVAPQ